MAAGAAAAELGDAAEGLEYARQTCASCHAVGSAGGASPVREATPFVEIANASGINRRALIVFFRTPHPTMPNLIVTGDDADDVIAYILSLKHKR